MFHASWLDVPPRGRSGVDAGGGGPGQLGRGGAAAAAAAPRPAAPGGQPRCDCWGLRGLGREGTPSAPQGVRVAAARGARAGSTRPRPRRCCAPSPLRAGITHLAYPGLHLAYPGPGASSAPCAAAPQLPGQPDHTQPPAGSAADRPSSSPPQAQAEGGGAAGCEAEAAAEPSAFPALTSLFMGGCGVADWASVNQLDAFPALRVRRRAWLTGSLVFGACAVVSRLALLICGASG